PVTSIKALAVSLLVGTPALIMVGSLGGALTITLPRGGVMLALLLLPLYVPILVLGCSAVLMSLQGFNYYAQLALLLALDIGVILLLPWAIAGIIKVSIG